MSGADLDERAARINAIYAARRAEREPAEAYEPPRQAETVAHTCARCGWTWRTFAGDDPKSCPACKARKWRTPAPPRISDTVRHCLRCGYEWRARKAARPGNCPDCGSRIWDVPPKI